MKKEYKKHYVSGIVIALTILSVLYMFTHKNEEYEITSSAIAEEETPLEIEEEAVVLEVEEEVKPLVDIDVPEIVETIEVVESVPIYVCGEVNFPDVYYLDETTIIKEAIMAAGGFTDEADQEAWNLAMEIQKGEKIYVPKVGEQIDKIANSYDNRVRESEPSGESLSETPIISQGLININQASAQELTALPGIGPTISQNIIDYRNANGEFKNLQDVTNVSRIGVKTLDKIKDHICFQ